MSRLAQRLERLEGSKADPAEARAAARQFDEALQRLVGRFSDDDSKVPESAQAEKWSPAQRTAWRMRFHGESCEQALVHLRRSMPRRVIEVVHAQIDALDWEL